MPAEDVICRLCNAARLLVMTLLDIGSWKWWQVELTNVNWLIKVIVTYVIWHIVQWKWELEDEEVKDTRLYSCPDSWLDVCLCDNWGCGTTKFSDKLQSHLFCAVFLYSISIHKNCPDDWQLFSSSLDKVTASWRQQLYTTIIRRKPMFTF